MNPCPGCDTPTDNVCCGTCWARIPTHLPVIPDWRAALIRCQQNQDMPCVERIREAVADWLRMDRAQL